MNPAHITPIPRSGRTTHNLLLPTTWRLSGTAALSIACLAALPTCADEVDQLLRQWAVKGAPVHSKDGYVCSRYAGVQAWRHVVGSENDVGVAALDSRGRFSANSCGQLGVSFSHESDAAAAVVFRTEACPSSGPTIFSCCNRFAVDVVDIPRVHSLCLRRPTFARRWVPSLLLQEGSCEAPPPTQVAMHWGLRECLVKILEENRAVPMDDVAALEPMRGSAAAVLDTPYNVVTTGMLRKRLYDVGIRSGCTTLGTVRYGNCLCVVVGAVIDDSH